MRLPCSQNRCPLTHPLDWLPCRTVRSILSRTVAITLLTTPLGLASASPVRWPGNGHFYDVVATSGTLSWEDANAAASAAGAYLATITSAGENAFVFGLVNHATYWHGSSGP